MPRPIDQRFLVALIPGPAPARLIQSADLAMLVEDRLFRIHGDELKDMRQRLVFLNHAADEMDIALEGVRDVGDILAGLVKVRRTLGSDALAGGFGRHRKIEDYIRPEWRVVGIQQLI